MIYKKGIKGMFRFVIWLPCVAALAGAIMLGTAGPARADIELTLTNLSTGATASGDPGVTGSTDVYTGGTLGNIQIMGSIGFTTSSTSTNAITELDTYSLTNTGTTAQTLQIMVSANGFTTPSAPPPMDIFDTISGSTATGSISGTAQGYADASNTLGGTGFSNPGLALSYSASGPSQPFQGTLSGFSPGFSNSGAYALTFIETITLDAGASVTLTGGNVQSVATPEPTSVITACTAVPFLVLGAWLRRRKQDT
jgi:hypothetical protein